MQELLTGAITAVKFLVAMVVSPGTEIEPIKHMSNELRMEFLHRYGPVQKELPAYVVTLSEHLPKDVLNEILSQYMLLIGVTRCTVYANTVLKNHVSLDNHIDKHYIFGCSCLKLTSDKKYYITVEADMANSSADQTVQLWNAQSKTLERMDNCYQAPFVYLKTRSQLLCFKPQSEPEKYSFVLYDIVTKKETIIKADIQKPYWNEYNFPIIVNSLENYCAIRSEHGSFMVNLNTLKIQEDINIHGLHECTFNNDGNLFVGEIYQNQSWLQVFALNKSNNEWEKVISDYILPFSPHEIRFMKNNYLLLFQNGRHGCDGFVHMQLLHDELSGWKVKTIGDSYGKGCIVQKANNDFFACWAEDKNFRLVAYDGSLVMNKDDFREYRSDFSQDGNYYAATSSGDYDFTNKTYTIKPELLLLSLNAKEKAAHIIKNDYSANGRVKFNKNSDFFITFFGKDCSLYSSNGEKVCSLNCGKDGCKFAPDGYGVVMKTTQENHIFLSEGTIKKLPLAQDIGFAEYFLLKYNMDNECKQKLEKCAAKWITQYIQ